EAAERRIGVSDSEIQRYIEEVAQRNNLSVDGFKHALEQEGRDFKSYQDQVQLEILKSKLTAAIFRGGIGVTDKEVEQYLKDHRQFNQGGAKVKLSQIVVGLENHSSEDARNIADKIHDQLINKQHSFEELARQFSEDSSAQEGGMLGIVAETDLNPAIFEAVMGLEEDQVSQVVETPIGFHIFRLEERYVDESGHDEKLAAEIRKQIEQQKLESSMQAFFATEIYKNHSVEKKI
ncbi:MAG: peptidylprolyl isomerase, partial [Bdellovibrionales bacterium]|nr:peptidylprolyl isomerase [Bdellovibrionales bacterium]